MKNALNFNQVLEALESLKKTTCDDGFVTFSDKRSDNFFQFAGGTNQPLHADLPAIALSNEEYHRADALFREYKSEPYVTIDDNCGKYCSDYSDAIFNADLDCDAFAAAKMVERVFKVVYQKDLDEIDLEINLNV